MSVLYHRNDTWTLVTWKQKSDEYWFGANVPNELLSVEKVKTGQIASYKKYNGQGLQVITDIAWQKRRITYILSQQTSIMP